jgi:2,4-dienoyl-CoA reductase-like NADH-dependent reductase (Old Yellow Enzyme family)
MATDDLVPTTKSADYYARRAEAGLIISEATIVRADGQGYPNTPGIFTPAQIDGWREITHAVHSQGGKIFLQLWHVGRVSHPVYLGGKQPIAPSAVPLSGRLRRSATENLEYGMPRALEAKEIPLIVQAFANGATNAIEAGFDGVEIHGANGYLIDQFLHYQTNQRTDEYGGNPEKNARFALEVIDAVVTRVGHERVGIRLSPGAHVHLEGQVADVPTFKYLLQQIQQRNLVYVHTGIFDDSVVFDYLGSTATEFLRQNYAGTVIGCGTYSPEKAVQHIEAKQFDLIAFGRPFIANHDMVAKLRQGETLKAYAESMLEDLY